MAQLAPLVLIGLLVGLREIWAVQALLFALLLTAPGCLLLRALRVPDSAVAAFPLYVPSASLVVLLLSGLAVNVLGPLVGVVAPLRPVPLLVGLELVCLLLFWAGMSAPGEAAISWHSLLPVRWLILPALLPLTAAAGALRLNNGYGNAVAVATVIACVVVLIAGIAAVDRLGDGRLGVLLFVVALAMMWSYALRSDLVYGFDIATEYATARATIEAGVWHANHSTDAYGAMLSITTLPAQLHALSGLPEVLLLKVAYPVVFALFPVGVFNLARRFLPRRWAFLAAVYVLAQGEISQQLPALARQEIALVLFVALVGAVFDGRMRRYQRLTMIGLFVPAVVMSHYSSAYFAIVMLGGAVALQLAVSVFRRVSSVNGALSASFAGITFFAVLWYVPITDSASNVSQFRTLVTSDGLQLMPHGIPGQSLFASYLNGTELTNMSASEYSRAVRDNYKASKPYIIPYGDSRRIRYRLQDAAAPKAPVVVPVLRGVLNIGELLAKQLGNLLALVGALVLVLRRRSPGAARVVGLLSIPALGFLAIFRLSGTFAVAYNQGRAQLQAMVLLSIPLFWVLHRIPHGRLVPARRAETIHRVLGAAAASAVITIFLNTSGLVGATLGGGTGSNLAATGEDFERFYMFTPELAAARWLGEHRDDPKSFVYGDRYGQLRLATAARISNGFVTDITPQTLNRHAWIYSSYNNTVYGRARSTLNGRLATYVFPNSFIDTHYNLVYANKYSKVFYR
ncbi:hypothetical protein [Planotetraspora sp. GP83]|uniref:hypothetical protein n=1 Tax=Planotetraspora sp. GP83 TaxID=3156264 RepID=UPI00351319FD